MSANGDKVTVIERKTIHLCTADVQFITWCDDQQTWAGRAKRGSKCKFPAWKDGFCKRHHPETQLAVCQRQIGRLLKQHTALLEREEKLGNAVEKLKQKGGAK